MKRYLTALSLLFWPALVLSAPLDEDVRWLSAYPAGGLPDTEDVRDAIGRLGDGGDRTGRSGGAKKLDKTHGRLPAHGRTRPSGAGRGVS